jgi:hypothetical protein
MLDVFHASRPILIDPGNPSVIQGSTIFLMVRYIHFFVIVQSACLIVKLSGWWYTYIPLWSEQYEFVSWAYYPQYIP